MLTNKYNAITIEELKSLPSRCFNLNGKEIEEMFDQNEIEFSNNPLQMALIKISKGRFNNDFTKYNEDLLIQKNRIDRRFSEIKKNYEEDIKNKLYSTNVFVENFRVYKINKNSKSYYM